MAAWPSMPSDFQTDQVMWIPVTWKVDPLKGGRVMVRGTPQGPFSCLVQGKSARDLRIQHREAQVITWDVLFNVQIAFNLRDQLIWVSGGNRIFTIQGVYPIASGTGRIWHCVCEEHPIS